MLDIGGWEFLVVAFVLLMVVGPKELPNMLRGFTRAVRRIRSMASEFTRGMEDLASDNELGDLKSTIADVKSGNLDRIADKIDPEGELKESVSGIKSNGDFDDAIEELSNIKNIGGDTGQQIASATAPAKTQAKTSKAKSARNKKS
ncbi:MAG: Sec-independent protein translocase protein TatB [Pseudomonadota bacterium]|nr:Sec-independent protein translocase protein TatB [Pseudomonadota bacterium]